MLRSVLALAVRSLREDTRSWRAHLYRMLFALFIFITLCYGQFQSARFGAPGLLFFTNLCWLNFLFITVGGISVFATPITEEKEEATLGLLRMAGINPLSLLLGKSTTRLFTAILLLLIQIPFTLLAITLGGVLWHQIFAAYLTLLAYLVFVAQLGLFCSVMCSRSSAAAGWSGVLLAMFLAAPYYLQQLFQSLAGYGVPFCHQLMELSGWLVRMSAWINLKEIALTGFTGNEYLVQVWSNFAAAGGLFVISWLTFDAFTRDHLTSVPARGALFRFRSAGPRPSGRFWLSPGRSWNLPLVWKEFHFTAGGFPVVVGKMIGYFAVILGTFLFFTALDPVGASPATLGKCAWATMIVVGGLELALLLSRIFREELRWQTYSALMMLPGSLGGMAWSKVGGVLIAWFPCLFWLGTGVLLDASDVGWFFREILEELPPLLFFFLLHYFVFLHLVVWLSLLMKWGGLPTAFVIAYPIFWSMLFGCAATVQLNRDGANALFAFLDLGCLFLMAVLQAGIWQQLNAHAEQA